MIINVSRWKTFKSCKHKALNNYHRNVQGERSINLVDGAAFHKGVAAGRATKDWRHALSEASTQFVEDVQKSNIPQEQEFVIQDHWNLVEKMLKCFEEQYEHETYQIIQPECEGIVDLPGTMHNCIFMHWWDDDENAERWGPPPVDKIMSGSVLNPHEASNIRHTSDYSKCICWQPHRFAFKTDAIVSWNHNIWLDEYKTTSISGDMFWDQWWLDIQPTAYLYGIWKLTGVRPRGFLLNAINKPSEAQVSAWNAKRKNGPDKGIADYIRLEREGFFRSEEDLARVERQLAQVAYEWEREISDPNMFDRFSMTPTGQTCKSYNRKCDYWTSCQTHDDPKEFESMFERERDYVDERLVQIQEAR